MSTIASSPAKAILFGEHAVVYGCPAIAIPLSSIRAYAEIQNTQYPFTTISAPDIQLNLKLTELSTTHPLRFAIDQFSQRYSLNTNSQLAIIVHAEIPIASGMGSGAAITTALSKALFAHFDISYTTDELSSLVYQVEKLHHGTPSGIDNAVTCSEKPLLYRKGESMQTLDFPFPFHLVIANSGKSTPTKVTVGDVRRLYEENPDKIKPVFQAIEKVSLEGLRKLQAGKFREVGEAMNANHKLLHQLTVSSPELDHMVKAALEAGAFGAKLSGGGRGGIVIALVAENQIQAVTDALIKAGATQTYYSQFITV